MLKIFLVDFPFLDNPQKTKARPALCLTKPTGKYKIVIVAFLTTQIDTDEILETDILIETDQKEFYKTGLRYTSLIRLHKLTSVPLDSVQGEVGTISSEVEQEIKKKLTHLFRL